MLQGVIANPDGSLSGRYLVVPAKGTTLDHLKEQTDASRRYWNTKANRRQPDRPRSHRGRRRLKMPMYGVGSLERRIGEAVDMGGTQQKHVLRLETGPARAGQRRRALRRRSLVLVARRAESHRLRGRQGRSVGRGCRRLATAAPAEGGLHAAGVVGRWEDRLRSLKRKTEAAAGTSARAAARGPSHDLPNNSTGANT